MDRAIVSVDINGKIDKYNSKFKEIFNLNDSEVEDKSVVQVLNFINEPLNKDFNLLISNTNLLKMQGGKVKKIKFF